MQEFRCAAILITALLLMPIATAAHQVEYRAPTRITTTVGELTTIQIDIKNTGSSAEYYRIILTATLPNEMQVTNSDISTPTINPGGSISVFSNIRTLTENPNVITVQIYRDNDLSHSVSTSISVTSKKFSLPEFGLVGFLQIMAAASMFYFILLTKIGKKK